MDRTIHLLGLNHRSADVAVREAFSLSATACRVCEVIPLDDTICEALLISTCNRVEIIAIAKNSDAKERLLHFWARHCGRPVAELFPHVYAYSGYEAVTHLFRVASGLDSLVLGEPQILGQLKDAYRNALAEQSAKVILNRLLHKAFMTAKRVRSETGVAANAVSISYAAVSLARRIFSDLHDKSVLVIGAGEMAELAATHLAEGQGARIAVTNRTHERAVALAAKFGGVALDHATLEAHLADADIVITSTGAREPIITAEMMHSVMKQRRDRALFIIDIAVPRDVEDLVNDFDGVYLYNIDDLAEVAEAGRAARREEAVKAESLIAEEAQRFCLWAESLDLQGTIADMVHKTEHVMRDELEKTLRRIGPLPEGAAEALQQMLLSVGKKLNHDPITFLKRRFEEEEAGMRFVTLARAMFNLDGESVPEDAHLGRKRDR